MLGVCALALVACGGPNDACQIVDNPNPTCSRQSDGSCKWNLLQDSCGVPTPVHTVTVTRQP